MPRRATRVCSVPGCPNIVRGDASLCCAHFAESYARQDAKRGTAAQRGYDYVWRQTRDSFLARHPTCVQCGAPSTVPHHIIRRRDGGSDADDNLMALCKTCHSRLHAKSGESWGRVVKIAG